MANITITLKKSEIMADVVSVAHITGRRLNVPGNEDKAADIQTPDEGADLYVVARAMEEGLSMLAMECGRYFVFELTNSDSNELSNADDDYALTLAMPEKWNYTAIFKLKSLANAYVRDWCIYSIFEKTNPEEAAKYLTKSQVSLSEIKPTLELRTAPIVRKLRLY